MSQIRTQINNIFLNSKVGDLFADSDGGQGVIDLAIDRHFTFEEIEECLECLSSSSFRTFRNNHQSYSNLQQFFLRLQKRMTEIQNQYDQSKENEYILNLIIEKKGEIRKKYPHLSNKHSQEMFVVEYLKKHQELKDHTFEQVKHFFENPISWI